MSCDWLGRVCGARRAHGHPMYGEGGAASPRRTSSNLSSAAMTRRGGGEGDGGDGNITVTRGGLPLRVGSSASRGGGRSRALLLL